MREMERMQHQLHSQMPSFQRKVDWTQQIIHDALEKQVRKPWYIALSGGSDSQVLLDMLFNMGVRCDVVWGDDGIDYPQTLQFLSEIEARYHFRLRRIRSMQPWRDWCMEMLRPDLCEDPDALTAWLNPHSWDMTWHTLTREAPREYGGVFTGMLACESATRRMVTHGGRKTLYQVKREQGIWHCHPLAMWTKRDIWSYLLSHDLPYNPVYDVLASLDVPLEYRRVAALTCFRVVQYGSVVRFRQGWPELYNTLSDIFPAIRQYS